MSALHVSLVLLAAVSAVSAGTERPIIGILTQESGDYINSIFPQLNFTAYAASSYVKFIESGGARVAPVLIGQPQAYYERLFTQLNGLVMPGGDVDLTNSEYGKISRIFWQLVHDHPEQYFPIWGECLGHETLATIAAGGERILEICLAANQTASVQFNPDELPNSRIFANASQELLDWMELEPNVAMNHHQCVPPENLDSSLRAVAFSRGLAGRSYVAVLEHHQLPIYGIAFHPEKAVFEWSPPSAQRPHGAHAISIAQYLANFLVSEARRSDNSFEDPAEEQAALIYNYQAHYSAARGFSFEQLYFFE